MVLNIRSKVRIAARALAKALDKSSGGRIKPNHITFFGLFMHIPIALLIASGDFISGGILLIIFGLFDTLDGELARLQKRDSAGGMLLDASTDRIKEIWLFVAIGYYLTSIHENASLAWVIAALGGSLLVSYVKAKGETALSNSQLTIAQKNRLFQGGLFSFEIRMLVLVIALFADKIILAMIIIAILAWFTAVQRLFIISRKLKTNA